MSQYAHILTSNLIYIKGIVLLLDEQNITTLIKDNTESARLAGFGTQQNDVELHVLESQQDQAQKIIANFEMSN